MPGPQPASAAVATTHSALLAHSSSRLRARRSAQAPINGALSTLAPYEIASAAVQASVAQVALPATTATK